MRTPSGQECPFFYGDYYRGKNTEECRLIGNRLPPHNWTPDLCATCPVPGVLRANSCPNLVLEAAVKKRLFGLKRQVKIFAACKKTLTNVKKPEVGCGLCHTMPESIKRVDK